MLGDTFFNGQIDISPSLSCPFCFRTRIVILYVLSVLMITYFFKEWIWRDKRCVGTITLSLPNMELLVPLLSDLCSNRRMAVRMSLTLVGRGRTTTSSMSILEVPPLMGILTESVCKHVFSSLWVSDMSQTQKQRLFHRREQAHAQNFSYILLLCAVHTSMKHCQ